MNVYLTGTVIDVVDGIFKEKNHNGDPIETPCKNLMVYQSGEKKNILVKNVIFFLHCFTND